MKVKGGGPTMIQPLAAPDPAGPGPQSHLFGFRMRKPEMTDVLRGNEGRTP